MIGHVRVHERITAMSSMHLATSGNFAHLHARLTVPLKLERRLEQSAGAALALRLAFGGRCP